ncbi:Uncharacterized protein PECH_005107 [Penicillium ucsense]|uniref:Uncharacterized protein n=1 Tax=Penicillium ucsense TaxID=2839758 RepID=A0A8J8WH38_9EURO|nr:Uncharacterized protein PECM_005917 [Penicillium ucsense]KAF7736600.1 Uncharacterized protein PECH_005107 [Penicillium ucsense]
MPAQEGRQSPEPETQSGAQLHEPPASGKVDNKAPELSHEKDSSKPASLESNPTHSLEKAEAEKFKKQ